MRRTNQCPTIARLTTDRALWPRARVRVTATASPAKVLTRLIAHTVTPSIRPDSRQDDTAAEAIDKTPDTDRTGRAEQSCPEVELRVIDAADGKILQQGLGNQTEPLCSSWECSDHGCCGNSQHEPSVVAGQLGAPFHCSAGGVSGRAAIDLSGIAMRSLENRRCRRLTNSCRTSC